MPRRTTGRAGFRKVRPSRSRRSVTRAEFVRLRGAFEEARTQVARHRSELEVQFKRIAQLQAEMEELRRDVRKLQQR